MTRHILRFLRNQQALAMIEFAMVAPILILLLFGSIEIARYILILQKVEKTAYSMTNMVSQFLPATNAGGTGQISNTAMNGVFKQFYEMMAPYSNGSAGSVTNGIVVFDSVIHLTSGNRNLVRWERTGGGDCSECTTARPDIVVYPAYPGVMDHMISATPGTFYNCPSATFPEPYATQLSAMLDNENFIVGQIYFQYEPLLSHILPFSLVSRTISRAFFLHPRNGDLLNADPAFVPPGAPGSAQDRCNNA